MGRRGLAAPAPHRRDRRLPDACSRSGDADRGDARARWTMPSTRARCAGSAPRTSQPSRSKPRRRSHVAPASIASSLCRTTTRWWSARPRTRSMPTCEKLGIGFLPYFPLASGLLTGKYTRGEEATEGRLAGREIPDARWDRARRSRLTRTIGGSRCSTRRSAACWRCLRVGLMDRRPPSRAGSTIAGVEPARTGGGGRAGHSLISDAGAADADALRGMFRDYFAWLGEDGCVPDPPRRSSPRFPAATTRSSSPATARRSPAAWPCGRSRRAPAR